MIPVREFIEGPTGFPSLLNYFKFVSEGVLLNFDGSLSACWYYKGPDMESSLGAEEDSLALQTNNILQQMFGTGWAMHVDLMRVPANEYPTEHFFKNATSILIEEERRESYVKEGVHFENVYTITITYWPGVSENKDIQKLLFRNAPSTKKTNLEHLVSIFERKIQEFEEYLSNRIQMTRMESQDMMTFLNMCISGTRTPMPLPEVPVFLNYYLGAHEFIGGVYPKIDNKHIGVITLIQFPNESYSGILNVLHNLDFEYRFSSRFLFLDAVDAVAILKQFENKFSSMKYSIGQMIAGIVGQDPRNVPDAANRAVLTNIEETKDAQHMVELGQTNFGYYTSVVVIFDENRERLEEKLSKTRKILEGSSIHTIIESVNLIEGYLGSLPGDTYKNVRKPIISTQHLANMLPFTDIWSGHPYCPCPPPHYPEFSPPLFYAATSNGTPFRFNVHVGDLGHTGIFGPTGSGKSVLLSHMANSFLRYPEAQVFFFDNGYSQFVMTEALGGHFYDILGDESEDFALCPLGQISSKDEQMWASSWIEKLLQLQGVAIDPKIRSAIDQGIRDTSKSDIKTLTSFYYIVQDDKIKEALSPFITVRDGYMSKLMDADKDAFHKNNFQVFEISNLMSRDYRVSSPVLLYILHQIERSMDGRPTFLIIDEGWKIMLHEVFMNYWIEFLRTVRKKNCAVILATQSLADIVNSPYLSIINESCLTKIFLPNPSAKEKDSRQLYETFSLNEQQIEIISNAVRQKQYYFTARTQGERLIDLGLSKLDLAFYGQGTKLTDRKKVVELKKTYGDMWVRYWLEDKKLSAEAKRWAEIKLKM